MGGVFLSPHCMKRLCESLCHRYDNVVKRLRGGYVSSLSFVNELLIGLLLLTDWL